ncbi:MAG: NUDIX hydrolase [Desulfurococcales archaeon]|nr:NUDIX hydrolase [Desulfurococcales archaeon]
METPGGIRCKGRRVLFESRRERYPDGREAVVDRVFFPDSVAVIPFYSRSCQVALVKQYRPAIREYLLEAPAGTISEGENPEEAAIRELAEEANLKPSRLELVAKGYLSPGYSTEMMHLYIAWDPYPAEGSPEEYELILGVERVKLAEALEMVREGSIRDVKTILLIMALVGKVGPGCEGA